MKNEDEVIFEQDFLKARVVKTKDGEYDIEFAMLEGPSIAVTESNEFVAKTIFQGLQKAYIESLKELQSRMRDALSSISDEAKEDVPSDKESHIEDKTGGDS
jgi:hypothetical protein